MLFRLHGVPKSYICDRDPKFTSKLFDNVSEILGIKMNRSTAAHPQTDGQSERTNRTIETMLRHYAEEKQKQWEDYLFLCEFAYNSAQQSSTKRSPFFLNYGREPTMPIDFLPVKKNAITAGAEELTKALKEEIELAKRNLTQAQRIQKKYADDHRTDIKFEIGDKVYLSTDSLRIFNSSNSNKLNPKQIGPYKVIKKLSDWVYELGLPKSMNIHPVFHISRLFKEKEDPYFKTRVPEPPPAIKMDDGGIEYEVEKILKKRPRGRGYQYLVKWKGYSADEASWLPTSQVQDLEALDRFEEDEAAE